MKTLAELFEHTLKDVYYARKRDREDPSEGFGRCEERRTEKSGRSSP